MHAGFDVRACSNLAPLTAATHRVHSRITYSKASLCGPTSAGLTCMSLVMHQQRHWAARIARQPMQSAIATACQVSILYPYCPMWLHSAVTASQCDCIAGALTLEIFGLKLGAQLPQAGLRPQPRLNVLLDTFLQLSRDVGQQPDGRPKLMPFWLPIRWVEHGMQVEQVRLSGSLGVTVDGVKIRVAQRAWHVTAPWHHHYREWVTLWGVRLTYMHGCPCRTMWHG
jgi:hypothetical protein